MKNSKFIGCIMIVIGTTVGAGMLELPTISAVAGFTWASILIVAMWALAVIAGLMILEVNLAFPIKACSFSTMAQATLGNFGRIITWVSYLLLLYSITAAYIAGGSSLITTTIESTFHIKIPDWINAVSFVFILGLPVYFGTKIVDYFNRGLIGLKGLLFLVALILILPHVNIDKLVATQSVGQTRYLWIAAPIFLLAFFYHSVIPSLRIYIGNKPGDLKKIIIWGTTISLIIYLLWLVAALGVVPLIGKNSFTNWAHANGSVGEFIQMVATILHDKWITSSIDGFSNIAMTTSFLGVTLGLFDFLADGFKIRNTKVGRLKTAGLTFIPPLIFALFYPKGFTLALNYAAIFVAIIALILPSLMICRLRNSKVLKSSYRMFGCNIVFVLVFISGIVLVALPIMSNLQLLPSIRN
jgi:tyrosine-specific transport protein